jgi:tRNA(fMet)-specific endonuclease VapC
MTYILDTNIIIYIARGKKLYFEQTYDILNPKNELIISSVTVGEARSFAIQRNWGLTKRNEMERILSQIFTFDVNLQPILNRYAEIDAYSKGKLPNNPLGLSSRNMGKNDLWIAATASVLNATLLTTDNDFDHLHNKYIQLQKVDNQLIV